MTVSSTDAGISTVTYTITSLSEALAPDGGQVIYRNLKLGKRLPLHLRVSSCLLPALHLPVINEGQSLSSYAKATAQQGGVASTLAALTA